MWKQETDNQTFHPGVINDFDAGVNEFITTNINHSFALNLCTFN